METGRTNRRLFHVLEISGYPIEDIDIEILFFVEYSQTCNISPVGLLFRQTIVCFTLVCRNKSPTGQMIYAKNITACNKNTIRTMNKVREKNTENEVYHSMQILYIKICLFNISTDADAFPCCTGIPHEPGKDSSISKMHELLLLCCLR